MNMNYKKILQVVVPLVIAMISMFGIAKVASSAEFHASTIAALEEKEETVLELSIGATTTSALITMLPDDTATPIAEKLVDFSSWFLIVLCAIYLEKYLLTITGYTAFMILIPAACVLFAASAFVKPETCRHLAKKLAIFGIAIVLVIPLSVKVSSLIESTYEESIQQTLETAKETAEEVEKEAAKEDAKAENKGFVESIKDKVSELGSTVADLGDKVKASISNFIEALAVLIVTSCVIPLVVIMFFIWLIKSVLAIDIPMMSMPSPGKKPMDMFRSK